MIKFSASQAYLGQSFKDLLEIPEYASNWYRLLLGEETEQDWLGGFVQDTEHGNGWAMRDEISDVSLHDAAGKTLYWQPHGEDWEHAQVDSAHQTASDVFTDPPEWLQIWTGKLDDQNNVVDGGVVDTSEINPHGQGWIESQDLEDLTVTQEQEDHNHVYARTAGGEWQHVQMEFSDAPKLDLYLEQDVVPDDVDTSDGYTLGGFGIPDADPEDSFDYQVTGGADQDVFTIQNGGLVFEAGTEIDYHAQSEYEVEVTGQDQDGNESIETFTVYVTYADGAGNSRAEAREIGVLSQGDTFEHSEDVGRLGDHADYYSFELEDNLDVAVEASGQDETRNAMGLRLYDSQGSLISHSNQDNDQESIAVTLEEGVYYVNVYEYLGRSEDYDLSIRADTFRTADSPEKAMEIGELSPGDSREHSVEVFDRIVREDYYTFTLTEQGQVDISMLFDEDLDQNLGFRILDSDEEHIEFDVSDTGEAFLSQELEAGDYYIEAWPVHGSHEYELNVDVNEPGGTLEDFSSEAGDTELNKTAADKATASNQKKEYFQEESDSLGTEQMDYDFSQSYTENSSLSTENDSSNILNFSDDSIGMWAGEEGVSLDKTFDDFLLDETIEGSPIFETASHELSYNYHTSIKAGLLAELNLETGHLDLDYPVDMDPGVPETVSSGQSFSVDTSDYSLTEATLQSNAPNPNDFGFSVDLIPPQLEMSVSDISLDAPLWSPASSFEYSGFDVDIAPAGDPISLVDGTLGDFELDQDFGPVGFEMGMPTGLELESQPVSSHTLDPVSTQGDDYGTTDDSFVNLGLSLTGLAQNAFGFPDLLESSYDFGVAELGYTVADVSANLGLTFAQDFTFEPGEVEVSMQTQDGQVQTGQLGDDFTFDAPEDSGSMDIDATYTLNGEINNNTGVMPNGSITADVLDAHLEILDFVDIGMDPLYSDEFPDGGWDALDEPLWLYENTFDLELEEDVTYQTEIGDDLPAHLSIDSFGDVSVQESQTVTVAAAVENTGDRETTQNISLSVDDVHLEEEFTIPAGDTRDISFDLDTAEHGLDIGEYDLELDTGDESESVTLEVLPADDESDDDFLEIYDISISPESPGVGESFSVKVKGFGAQSADAVNPSVTLAIPKDDYEHTFNPASLDDGQTEEVIFLEGIVDAGEYKAEVTVDAVNAQSVTEQIEFAIGGSDQDVHYVVTDYEELDFALQDKEIWPGMNW
ncbi:peptidase domain protein [Desulfonatronospira thiodismutans ASO3-1]|uniref:Peptidase domain protein n=1 Tax=Desulfonatronospira thiodismutans ASO3-1 TaxID=555779 RepID=D6SN84_9BACT|nr:pre-peptidase C-terminal domain-containing protein [Desulfonatronospira thiodismutans]EFI34210.1 peptidase domain protein [Desulfonatronospira thiodismutans ASO3-1]